MSRVEEGRYAPERPEREPVVLVVDDDPLLVSVLTGLLTTKNYSVIKAYSGTEALKVIRDQPVDLILCDALMPGMTGYEFLRLARKEKGCEAIPVVFLISGAGREAVSFGGENGVGHCVPKPINPTSILAAVRDSISRQATSEMLTKQDFDAYRKRVVRTLSHEFRTPLLAITHGTDLLLEQRDRLNTEKATKVIEAVRQGGLRLEKLVRDFLTVQQMEAGITKQVFYSHAVCVPISELLEHFVETKGPAHQSGDAVLRAIDESGGAMVKVVESNILDCLDRLVSNAVKFSEGSKDVEIHCAVIRSEVHIAVRDRGCGIDPSHIEAAVQVFGQLDRDLKEEQGAGLGLPIACRYAGAHNGRIEFKAREGGGSIVTLVLPIAEPIPVAEVDPYRRQQ